MYKRQGLRRVFGCFGTRVVSSLAILGIAACAGVPVVGFITAPFARPVMIESRSYYAPMIDDFCKSVSILKELTTLTLVVCLVTGVNAVGRLCFHLGQMGSADMTGSGSDYIVADSTLDRISFGCFSTIRCMISFVILSITAAAVVPVLGFVTAPFGRPVVTQSLAFDCVTSITGLRSGAGCIFPVMTESSDCNFAQIGRHKSIGILVKIAALALVVFLVSRR